VGAAESSSVVESSLGTIRGIVETKRAQGTRRNIWKLYLRQTNIQGYGYVAAELEQMACATRSISQDRLPELGASVVKHRCRWNALFAAKL
jgi:hypothetical protein